jgi:acyl carrier protein
MNTHQNGTSPERSDIASVVLGSLEEVMLMANGNSPASTDITEDTRLIGRESVLDSMGLVNLIVEIEQRLEEDYEITVILADDRAMSQRSSPFRSVQSLTDYICQLLEEQG